MIIVNNNAFFDKNEQIIYNKNKLVIDYLEGDFMDIDEFFEKVVKDKIKYFNDNC